MIKLKSWYKEWFDERMKDPEFKAGYEEYLAELIREERIMVKGVSVTPKDEKEFETVVDAIRKIFIDVAHKAQQGEE